MVGIIGSMNFWRLLFGKRDFCFNPIRANSNTSSSWKLNHFGDDSSFLVKFSPSDILLVLLETNPRVSCSEPHLFVSVSQLLVFKDLECLMGKKLGLWNYGSPRFVMFSANCQRGVGSIPATNCQEKHPTAFPVSPHYVSTSIFWLDLSHWNPSYHYIPSMIGLYQNRVSTTWCPS